MKTQKHHPNDKLQKSSIIFLQLGLILSMLLVYIVLESKFEQKELVDYTPKETIDGSIIYPPNVIFPEPMKVKKVKHKKKKVSLEKIKKVRNENPAIESILDSVIDNKDELNRLIDDLPNFTTIIEEKPELFVLVENAPIFPGCEDLDEEENKRCFTKQIAKFVNKKFNTDLAGELGLKGKQNIHVQFIIDKDGNVSDIKSRASHKRLEKEAKRIIEKLPRMTPGMQRKRAVPVKYTLPISFQVY